MVAAVLGMIPEGLYLLVSISLAMSAARLARNHVLLHDMKSTETLARVDVLCVDKTGTITENQMDVTDAVMVDETDDLTRERVLERIGDFANAQPAGNITMQAIGLYFKSNGLNVPVQVVPFSSAYKYSAVIFSDGAYVMGAPEIVLGPAYQTYAARIETYSKQGLRVLVFASYDGTPGEKRLTGKTVPLVFIVLKNKIRENAEETFRYFREQGVEVKVISGDNPDTVEKIAAMAGIPNAENSINAMGLRTDEDIRRASRGFTVFGRVTPEQKKKIVQALKADGKTVAMTGDGVNDILAMKEADCSIAIASGSEAAVQASQLVLLDSDFSHMPQVVGEGRRVVNNIQRSAILFLVKNVFSMLLAIFSIISVNQYPLQPTQISLISMFNIGIPGFLLALESNESRIHGRFMTNVLLRALPAALTDFLGIATLVIFGEVFGVDGVDISVAATFLLAIVGFMIQGQISAPLNKYRTGVLIGTIAALMFSALNFSSAFSITTVSTKCIMLFVLFAIATEPFMRYLTMLCEMVREKAAARKR